ncbi:MAG: hypothetical protein JF597_15510 [Streptomyces sp.]|uniref:hypothetical protein n=1 Tax=Streptomyces sp. TaxID=1931 RepID=UPI0025F3E381|nr:hypothetical protein [Streptomyces sp.]MBW8794957.1 hypothetical protein [Streptomyces sp.]
MHRTTTTAALLVTVTFSALSGCVTVQHPAAPGPPPGTAPSLPSVPRPDGSAEPRVVQAPVKEALEMVGPSRPAHRAAPAAPHAPVPAPPAGPPAPAAPRTATPHRPAVRRSHPPQADLPGLPRSAPKAPDVCALGKQYGGWAPDSPQARICEQTYGR